MVAEHCSAGSGLRRRARQGFGRLGELRLGPSRPAAHRQIALDACLPHGRPQAAHHRRCRRRRGYRLFRLGSRRCRRRSTALPRGSKTRGIKVARAARALADERHVKDLIVLQRPAGQSAGDFSRRRNDGRTVQARPLDLGIPYWSARARPRGAERRHRGHDRADDLVLSRHAGLPVDRLLFAPFHRPLPASQSAPSQPCLCPVRQERGPSRHDGAFQLRRRRPGLRSRLE